MDRQTEGLSDRYHVAWLSSTRVVYTDQEGNDRYTVVDGQQRLRACIEYLDDTFALDPEDSPDFANMRFSDLNPEQKKNIYNYNFIVRTLPDMPDSDLRAMFTRLNRNVVALNSQELRHATYWGEFIQTMEKIADGDQWSTLGIFTPNDVRRMLDIEFISEISVGYLHGLQNKKEQLDDWYQAYERRFERKEEVIQVFSTVLSELTVAFPDLERTRWRKKSDFYTLFLVLARQVSLLPFSREGRQTLRSRLKTFDDYISAYLGDPEAAIAPREAVGYALAVERAASDLANRKERDQILTRELSALFASEREARAAAG